MKEIDSMLKLGIIEPSFSKFNSLVLITPKPNKPDQFRLLFDGRKINTRIRQRKFDIPHIPEFLNQLPVFSFSVFGKSYRYTKLPQGTSESWAFFGYVLQLILSDFPWLAKYFDDLAVHTKSTGNILQDYRNHLLCLRKLFIRLRNHNVILSPDKCKFLQSKLIFLGFLVEKNKLVVSIQKLAPCKNVKEIQKMNN